LWLFFQLIHVKQVRMLPCMMNYGCDGGCECEGNCDCDSYCLVSICFQVMQECFTSTIRGKLWGECTVSLLWKLVYYAVTLTVTVTIHGMFVCRSFQPVSPRNSEARWSQRLQGVHANWPFKTASLVFYVFHASYVWWLILHRCQI
jgi:hypothetical protein